MSNITGIGKTKRYINREGVKLEKEFRSNLVNQMRKLSSKMQNDINDSVDKGAVAFTKRAILFTYSYNSFGGVTCTILVKRLQARYLRDIIVTPKSFEKFIPTSASRLTKEGNILGLRNNIRKGRYKVVKQRGKERLIDTQAKKRDKRVIGLRETKRREMIYNFYEEAEKGTMIVISNIQGVFKVKKG
ncbi:MULTISPECIES: hypothetical protein [Enterobacter cloacae complex]|uniref:hypothetical protein n=1 Tax=Enterobacter cloacae complex TaxID=354276 RepID=UPI0005EE6992|nr:MULTISPECIES: hypothetical protein [Enterobacter cloacae complex]ELD2093004.1 hypothetical protein [Enterobacter hormaechei]KJP07839.1 hypothetical protein SS02_07885 [Enterobacter hormaechei subsp. steigerwaltii]MCF2228639.1 hypothetical protein [Enterobacter cloacae]MDV5404834.1 hypothetical protein [Enterobacter cloacae]MEB7117362.1 hypothetical protein [Enterobacter cloacae]